MNSNSSMSSFSEDTSKARWGKIKSFIYMKMKRRFQQRFEDKTNNKWYQLLANIKKKKKSLSQDKKTKNRRKSKVIKNTMRNHHNQNKKCNFYIYIKYNK